MELLWHAGVFGGLRLLEYGSMAQELACARTIVFGYVDVLFRTFSYFRNAKLGRYFMHHVSLSVLIRTAAHVSIKCATWPQEAWGPYFPRPHIEWYVELCFSFMRLHHINGNLDVRDFAKQTVKHHLSQRRSLATGSRSRDADARLPSADMEGGTGADGKACP